MLPKDLKRLPAESYIGQRQYFLTFLTKSRRRFFADAAIVQWCAEQILRAFTQTGVANIVAVFMPDHLHLVVEGTTADSDLCAFAKLAKQLSGYHVKQRTRRPLWEKGFHDRVIRQTEDVFEYVRYVRENPVRAHLAAKPEDYPYLFEGRCSFENRCGRGLQAAGPSNRQVAG